MIRVIGHKNLIITVDSLAIVLDHLLEINELSTVGEAALAIVKLTCQKHWNSVVVFSKDVTDQIKSLDTTVELLVLVGVQVGMSKYKLEVEVVFKAKLSLEQRSVTLKWRYELRL